MAAGSHSGWNGLPAELRVCVVCRVKLTLKDHLWIEEHPVRQAFHAGCHRSYRRAA
jgi:hypothetical protein